LKVRDSELPDQTQWESFFDPLDILRRLSFGAVSGDVLDLGCGYGTFTLAAARLTAATVHAIDIDPDMVRIVRRRAEDANLSNIRAIERDFIREGAGVPASSCAYAMLFNILHAEDAVGLLRIAHQALGEQGLVAIIHWTADPRTPRGPPLKIRPTAQQCQQWLLAAGFELVQPSVVLPPYHFGLVGRRPAE
jgi:SAM-dependent methyltransferase